MMAGWGTPTEQRMATKTRRTLKRALKRTGRTGNLRIQRPWDNSIAIPCADGKWRRVPDAGWQHQTAMDYSRGTDQQRWRQDTDDTSAEGAGEVAKLGTQIPPEIKSSIFDVVDGLSAFLDADWIQGSVDREGQIRRLQNGAAIITEGMTTMFPLCGTVPGRAGILRGAGNAIVGQLAAELIKAFLEVTR
jgi:hypothetical protein